MRMFLRQERLKHLQTEFSFVRHGIPCFIEVVDVNQILPLRVRCLLLEIRKKNSCKRSEKSVGPISSF